jgi:glycosyltransferase involved in cell wall biosynthesis
VTKIKIAYVVSTLGNSGPTRQLRYIISGLDPARFECLAITLSPEPLSSLMGTYVDASIAVQSLSLGRLEGMFLAQRRLAAMLDAFKPDILHTQGLRADALASHLTNRRWVSTARNYPFDDYPMKFGRLRGFGMARTHMAALRRCRSLVACSDTIRSQLAGHGIDARTIHNGVPMLTERSRSKAEDDVVQFIVSGALITRKNMGYIITAFNALNAGPKASLLILGDGPERKALEHLADASKTTFAGHVANVSPYLRPGAVLVSSSLSEGLPNAVLEGFAAGCPALLSDIPAHREVHRAAEGASMLFPLDDEGRALQKTLADVASGRITFNAAATAAAADSFSTRRMSSAYTSLYEEMMASE